jgi:hypothetical protein
MDITSVGDEALFSLTEGAGDGSVLIVARAVFYHLSVARVKCALNRLYDLALRELTQTGREGQVFLLLSSNAREGGFTGDEHESLPMGNFR